MARPPLARSTRAALGVAVALLALAAAAPALSGGPGAPPPALRIDVNAAGAAELELLPNIGPARAEAIVASRRAAGRFRALADLERVRGIGPRTVRSLAPYATTGE